MVFAETSTEGRHMTAWDDDACRQVLAFEDHGLPVTMGAVLAKQLAAEILRMRREVERVKNRLDDFKRSQNDWEEALTDARKDRNLERQRAIDSAAMCATVSNERNASMRERDAALSDLARLRAHAEAMAEDLVDLLGDNPRASLTNYRAYTEGS